MQTRPVKTPRITGRDLIRFDEVLGVDVQRCQFCEVEKPLTAFKKAGSYKGRPSYRTTCKECQKLQSRSTAQYKRNLNITDILTGVTLRWCRNCKTDKPLECFRIPKNGHQRAVCIDCEPLLIKRCKSCLIEKPIDEFWKSGDKGDGRKQYCKDCACARKRECFALDPTKKHPVRPRFDSSLGLYVKKCRKCKTEKPLASFRMGKSIGPTTGKAYPVRRSICRDCDRSDRKTSYHADLKTSRIYGSNASRKRRARKHHAPIVETVEREAIIERDKGICYLCGSDYYNEPSRIHIDHVIPLSRQGSHADFNMAVACDDCNLRKSTKLPGECEWAKNRVALVLVSSVR